MPDLSADDIARIAVRTAFTQTAFAELLNQEARALEFQRAFIDVLSHELRTPMTTIYAAAEMLLDFQREHLLQARRRELDGQGLVNRGDRVFRELDVNDRADDLSDFAGVH